MSAFVGLVLLISLTTSSIPPPDIFWFDQRLDHFNPQDQRTFKQRYFVYNGSWNKANNGPIFFYAGNEAPIDTFYYNTGFMFDIADEFGALIVFTEQRYYGQSLPFGNDSFTLPNLQYFSMQQVIFDYAYFMTAFKESIYQTPKSSVVAFGGSQGGIYAALLRIHFADIFDISLASSAPIPMIFNQSNSTFFFQKVTEDYYNADSKCPDIVRAGYAELLSLSEDTNNYAEISKVFKTCKPLMNDSDIVHLQYWARNGLLIMAQFDYPYSTDYIGSLPAWPVDVACDILLKYSDQPMIALSQAAGLLYNASVNYTLDCFDIFDEYIFSADPTGCGNGPYAKIMDDYTECTQLLTPMDTNNITDMFPPSIWNGHNLTDYCWENYGLIADNSELETWFPSDVAKSGATNIIFSNGELDPFIGGGYTQNLSDRLPAIVIANAAHHLDLRGMNENDPKSVTEARALEVMYIKQWLSEIED